MTPSSAVPAESMDETDAPAERERPFVPAMKAEDPPADSDAQEAAPARRPLAIGAIELLDYRQVRGWAWYPPMPDEAIDVEILVDDAVVMTARADLPRPELATAGAGNGRHGFHAEIPRDHVPPGTHIVRVRRARDRLDLPGSRAPVTRPEAVPGDDDNRLDVRPAIAAAGSAPVLAAAAPIGNLDRVSHAEISGWVWDSSDPDKPVDVEIMDGAEVVLRVTADQSRPDLAEACMGHGNHGFTIQNLNGVFPLSRHRVRVRRASDGLDLPKSPAWITRSGISQTTLDFMYEAVSTAIESASKPDDLSQPLAHVLSLVNDLVNRYEGLAQDTAAARPIEATESLHLTGRTRELVDHLRYSCPPLHFTASDEPEVSVIIPVHNQFSVTYDCLRSIYQAMPARSFEIIIVDDCSDDETLLAALVFSGAVRILRNTSNLMFVKTCNAGAAQARGKYLFFLNNDTLVREGWLDELVETFEQVPNIGIAGSKLLFPDGKLQEAGGIVWRLGDGWNWGRGRDADEPAFSYLRDADWVSGAALMIERTLFEDLGGFDELFVPAYYEDTDLAFRVRAQGRRVVVQPASQIVHLEGVSAGTDTSGPGMKRFQVINNSKFYRRWKDTLLSHRFNGQQPELEAERLVRKRALFIDDTVLTPDKDAGSVAAMAHIKALMALGYKVTFVPADNMAEIAPYTGQLQKIGVECLHHPYFGSVEDVLRKAAVRPDLVYLHRFTNASKYATMIRRYSPECRIIFSVCDLHFLRMERQALADPGSVTEAQVIAQRREELAVMEHVDSVIVYSSAEAALLLETGPDLNVHVVPWTVQPRPTVLPFSERSGTAFVGGFGHPPNADAVRYLMADILPLVRTEFRTYLVGSNMPASLLNLQVPGVLALGFVPVLADILHRLRCTVVPLRYGAGIKGKVLESLAHGLPCVMSEVAAEGLELPEDLAWLVARSPAEFAEKLTRVHEDEGFNAALSAAGLDYIARRHGAGVVVEALRAAAR